MVSTHSYDGSDLLVAALRYRITDIKYCHNVKASTPNSVNPGCSLQITKHLQLQWQKIALMHPMELLDYSIRGEKIKL